MPQRLYKIDKPVQLWQTKKARVDLVVRLNRLSKLCRIPMAQLFNEILDKELTRMEKLTVEELLIELESKQNIMEGV